ncbi:MAG: FHA domain-containing protein, partial [Myxococcota bacterium]|nr:FHA domain-containing protein [Myxococcota bacterium]
MGADRQQGVRRTARLTEEALQRIRDRLAQQHEGERISLLIYHRDGVQAVPLQTGRRLVVGRFPPADVIVRDASLSAEHAAVTLEAGTVWVEDLGSTNGTRIDGAPVERERLDPGSELLLGAVVAAVHAIGEAGESSLTLLGHDRLARELEIEVGRAQAFRRSTALLMLRHPRQHVSRWFEGVGGLLRPFDRAALYSGDTVEILLPDAGLDHARKLAEGAVSAGVRAGFAVYPDDATTAEALVEATRVALRRTSNRAPPRGASDEAKDEPEDSGTRPVVRSAAMREVFNVVGRLATSDIPVLILGETGTGKEVQHLVDQVQPGAEAPRGDRPHHGLDVGGGDQGLAHDALEQDRPQGKQVGAGVDAVRIVEL